MSNFINTTTISEELAKLQNTTNKDAKATVDFVFNSIKNALVQGEEVRIAGFGIFATKDTEARKGRNPQTGEELDIPASKKVSFRVASALKDAVKETV